MNKATRQSLSGKNLSRQEMLIAQHLADGKSAKQIAVDVGLSYTRVRDALRRAYAKKGVHSQRELACFANAPHEEEMTLP